jgi:hypothetical protein
MHKLITGQAKQYSDPETGEPRIAIPFQIVDEDGKELFAHTESFPAETPLHDIRVVLERHLATYGDDAARHEQAKELQAKLDAGSETVSEISNITL